GQCETPRQAWLQLLYWLQKDRYAPKRAALCFDTSRLKDPAAEAPQLAAQLIQILDANGWYVNSEELPTDPDHLDATNRHRYEDAAVQGKGITVYKRGGRWLFTPDTLGKVPDLYPGLTVRIVNALPAWFRSQVIGIEVWKLLGVFVLIFIAFIFQKLTVFVIRTYLRRLVKRTNLSYLDAAVHRADRPIGGLMMAVVFYLGFPNLLFPAGAARIARVATEALAAYSLVWLAYRLIDVLTTFLESKAEKTESKLDDQVVPLLGKTLKVFVSVIGGIFVLQNLDVDVSSLLAGLGLGGLAFALAAKDTVANFFGSVTIFVDKPFQIGDWVVMAGTEGVVEEVGFRTTRVRTFYGSLVTVPNHKVTGNIVDNYGARKYRRYSTTLGLCYDTPPEKIQAFCEALRASIKGMPGMRQDYYMVEFKEFADFSLNIMLYCFMEVPTWNDELRVRTNLNLEILRVASRLGVSFAFPTQTLHVDSLVESGGHKPTHSEPPGETKQLIAAIKAFAPGGKQRMEEGFKLSRGFYCGDEYDPDTQNTAGRGGDAAGEG
ncbi:MAG: mechanosensitive ion channel family protein, partial [Deltaproteobacteria bacterium]|nr:mechanosensitive ion channel family protein [Deltaproteobacteria bacterium]